MSISLLDFAFQLLFGAVSSIGQPVVASTPTVPQVEIESKRSEFSAGAERRRERVARVGLTDPYYSFRRTRRAEIKG